MLIDAALLSTGIDDIPATARDLSQLVRIREKEVASHLEHLEKSLKHSGKELVIEPAECLTCGFVFRDRTRHARCAKYTPGV